MKFRFIEDRRASSRRSTRPTGQFKRQERTHRWIKLGGKVNADEVRKSNERRKIVAAPKEASDEITPTAIAKLTGMKVENVRVLIRKMTAGGEVIQPRVVRCANLSQTSGLSPLYRTPVILVISITLINTVIRIIGVYIDWHGLAGPVTSWMASAFGGISVVPIPAPSGPIVDPLQTWGRGSATPYAEHRSNLNVINISAKKSEP